MLGNFGKFWEILIIFDAVCKSFSIVTSPGTPSREDCCPWRCPAIALTAATRYSREALGATLQSTQSFTVTTGALGGGETKGRFQNNVKLFVKT